MSVGWASDLIGRLLAERVDHGRFVRGRELLDDGRVLGLEVRLGRATAAIVGSRLAPYEVTVRFPVDGRPGHPDDLRFDCTCPDWGDPCKHGVAVAFAVAEVLDDEPELAPEVWGEDAGAPPARPLRPTSTAMPVGPLPTERPAWADVVGPASVPTTVEQWLGRVAPSAVPTAPPADDPLATMSALGPLVVGDGWDLAPAVRRLVLALLEA